MSSTKTAYSRSANRSEVRTIAIVPNHGLSKTGTTLHSPPGFSLILDDLIERGFKVHIVAQQVEVLGESNLPIMKMDNIAFMPLGKLTERDSRLKRAINYPSQFFQLIRCVKKFDFFYVFIPGHVALLAVVSCWMKRVPYGLYYRGDFSVVTPRIFHFLKRFILKRAVFVMCTAENLKKEVSALNPNVDVEVPISPLLSLRALKPQRSYSEIVRILFVGQIVKDKGIFELLDAFNELYVVFRDKISLTYIGDGGALAQLKDRISEYGRGDAVKCVRFCSDQAQLSSFYQEADIFCLPSYHEGFPRVIYEAAKFELPVVATPVGQISSFIIDRESGLLCEPRSVASLKTALQELIVSPSLRLSLGLSGRERLRPIIETWNNRTHGQQVACWIDWFCSKA